MKIGITYDLIDDYLKDGYSEEEAAEFDRPDTIDAIESALVQMGHAPDRIGNVKALVQRLATGDRWDLVFNIAEGMYGLAREAQIPALLEAYQIPYTFSTADILSLCLNKSHTKQIIKQSGIPTPEFATLEKLSDVQNVSLPYPLFAKPLAEGTSKGVTGQSRIENAQQLRTVCDHLLSTYRQPVLVETFLPGREVTVGIVGTGASARVIGILEIILKPAAEQDVYTYTNKAYCEELVHYALLEEGGLAEQCRETALRAWRALGCRDAGRVDLRMDQNGIPSFIEINPLAGLNPGHSDLPIMCTLQDISYGSLLDLIMKSVMSRIVMPQKVRKKSPCCVSMPSAQSSFIHINSG